MKTENFFAAMCGVLQLTQHFHIKQHQCRL